MTTIQFLNKNRINRMHQAASNRRHTSRIVIEQFEQSESRNTLFSAIRLSRLGYDLRETIHRNLDRLGGMAGQW